MHQVIAVTITLSLYTMFAYCVATNPEKYHCFSRYPSMYAEVDAKAKEYMDKANLK